MADRSPIDLEEARKEAIATQDIPLGQTRITVMDVKEWEDINNDPHEKDEALCAYEEKLAQLQKLCPELKSAAKSEGDLTTLWALACLARLVQADGDWKYEISLVADTLRQRLVSGHVGDNAASRGWLIHMNPPLYQKILRLYINPKQAKHLKEALIRNNFQKSPKGYHYAYETPHRVQFYNDTVREYNLSTDEDS
tara:strand:+ start:177 stop:764 length:588 start_codon:yes stop_codon:yes gene_type:complete